MSMKNCKIVLNRKLTIIMLPLLFSCCVWKHGMTIDIIVEFLMAILLCVIAETDGYTYCIPDELIMLAGALGAVTTIFCGSVLDHMIGFFLVSSLLLMAAMIKPGTIGGGDVKLMAAAGMYLGTTGVVTAFVIGSITACMAAAAGITLGRLNRKSHMAMAPYYVFGIYIAMFLLPS